MTNQNAVNYSGDTKFKIFRIRWGLSWIAGEFIDVFTLPSRRVVARKLFGIRHYALPRT